MTSSRMRVAAAGIAKHARLAAMASLQLAERGEVPSAPRCGAPLTRRDVAGIPSGGRASGRFMPDWTESPHSRRRVRRLIAALRIEGKTAVGGTNSPRSQSVIPGRGKAAGVFILPSAETLRR